MSCQVRTFYFSGINSSHITLYLKADHVRRNNCVLQAGVFVDEAISFVECKALGMLHLTHLVAMDGWRIGGFAWFRTDPYGNSNVAP